MGVSIWTPPKLMLANSLPVPPEKGECRLTPSASRLRRLADELETGGERDLALIVRRTADATEDEAGGLQVRSRPAGPLAAVWIEA